ncbi:hypothetical protein C5167_046670, partial [Papaver somniferum]
MNQPNFVPASTSSILSAQAGNMDENPQPPAAKEVTGGVKLNFLNKLKKVEKVSLEFCWGAPVGPNANKMSAYCGKLALNGENFPFDIPDWSDMPKEENLEESIEELKDIFHYSYEINFWVEEKIHEKWKAGKRNMRKPCRLNILSLWNFALNDAQNMTRPLCSGSSTAAREVSRFYAP